METSSQMTSAERLKATLHDAGDLSAQERAQAEALFCKALADELGGIDAVAPIYLSYRAVNDLGPAGPREETQGEREAVVRWIKAETTARRIALPARDGRQRGHFELHAG